MNPTFPQILSTNPVLPRSFLTRATLSIIQEAVFIGLGTYSFEKGRQYFNFVPKQPLDLKGYLLMGAMGQIVLRSIEAIYLIGYKIIGSRPSEEMVNSEQKIGAIGKGRKLAWTVVSLVENTQKKADEIFSRIFNIRTSASIDLLSKEPILSFKEEEFELSAIEKCRKIFKVFIQDTVKLTVSHHLPAIMKYTAGGLMAGVVIPELPFYFAALNFLSILTARIQEVNQWIDLKIDAHRWIQSLGTKQELEVIEELDFTKLSEHGRESLTAFKLENLLPLCPKAKKIKLSCSDLSRIQGFTVDVKEHVMVELIDFPLMAHSLLWNHDEHSNIKPDAMVEVIENGQPVKRPLYREMLEQFPVLKWYANLLKENGDINLEVLQTYGALEKQRLGIWLNVLYTGVCPLYLLNPLNENQNLQKHDSLVGQSKFSDFTIQFKDQQTEKMVSFPAHQKLLKAKSGICGLDDSTLLELDGMWNHSTIQVAIQWIYEGQISSLIETQNIYELFDVLKLAKQWKLDDLDQKIQAQLCNKISQNFEMNLNQILSIKSLALSYEFEKLFNILNEKEKILTEKHLIQMLESLNEISQEDFKIT